MTYNADDEPCWSTATTVSSPSCTTVPTGATTYTYNANGQRTASTPAAGSGSVYTYDEAGNLASSALTSPAGGGGNGSDFVSLPPHRIADTRTGYGQPYAGQTLGANGTLNVQATGVGGVPSTGVTAVVINLALASATAYTYVQVYPAGSSTPVASVANLNAGSSAVNNQTTVKVGTGGQITIRNNSTGNTDVIVDVLGYYTGSGTGMTAMSPVRITDTRAGSGYPNAGSMLAAGGTLNVQVAGTAGVPAGTTAVVVEITVLPQANDGYLITYPAGTSLPVTSTVNYMASTIVTKEATVKLGTSPSGAFTIWGSSSVNIIVDVVGFYASTGGDMFVPIAPVRVTDTRTGYGPNAGHPITAGGTLSVQVAGVAGLPANGISAVIANISVPDSNTSYTYEIAYPSGTTAPTIATNVTYNSGAVAFNEVTAKLGTNGALNITNAVGTTDVIVDILGYFYNPQSTSYAYDAQGLRQSSTVGGATTNYTWDQAGSMPMLLADGTNYYVYGQSNMPLEQINSSTGTVTYLHADQLGSTRLLTDTSGNTVGTNTYDPYGTRTASTGTVTTPLGYAGQYTDNQTGLIYLRARYYDPTTAQFMSRDPLEAQTRSAYGYVRGDPLDGSDPTGLCDSNVFSSGFWGSGNCLSGLVGGPNGGGGESVGGVIKSVAGIAGGAAAAVGVISTGGVGAAAAEAFAGGAEATFSTFEGGFAWTNGATAAADAAARASLYTVTASAAASGAVDCPSGISAACVYDAASFGAGPGLAYWPGGAIGAWLGLPLTYPWDTVVSSCEHH